MPFLEFLLGVISFFLIAALLVFAVSIYAGFILFAVAILTFTGWLPIMVCISDASISVGDPGFWGTWAKYSVIVYLLEALGIVALKFIKPDPDGLPPAFKFLAMFYTFPTAKAGLATAGNADVPFEGEQFAAAVNDAPSSIIGAKLEARQMRQATEQVKAEAERVQSASELAEAAIELEQLRARQRALEDFIEQKKH